MKLKKEDHSTDLIQKARSALDQGDRENARAYALSALEEKVQVEQAWLILASISEPDQALQYIENVLRFNPESQPAHKAVKLIFNQMSKDKPQTREEPPVNPLEDTHPIHISPIAEEPERTEEEPEQTEIEEIQEEANPVIPQIKPESNKDSIESSEEIKEKSNSVSKKTMLRRKLSARPATVKVENAAKPVEPPIAKTQPEVPAEPVDELPEKPKQPESQPSGADEPLYVENLEKQIAGLSKKTDQIAAQQDVKNEAPLTEEADEPLYVESLEKQIAELSKKIDQIAAQPDVKNEAPSTEDMEKLIAELAKKVDQIEAQPTDEKEKQAQEPIPTESPDKVEAVESFPPVLPESEPPAEPVEEPFVSPEPVQSPEPEKPKAIPVEAAPEPDEWGSKPKDTHKKAVIKPQPSEIPVKAAHILGNNPTRKTTDVDTIELVLISIAAILIPLMIFLYFLLTK